MDRVHGQPTQHSVRDQLIDAATRLVREHGAAALTLDAVARMAGMSKGGLLHHFPTKTALIEGMLRALMDNFVVDAQAEYASDTRAPGRWLRAYVRATFDPAPPPLETIFLLLGVITDLPAFLPLLDADSAAWLARLTDDGIDATRARLIRMAADAYWIERALAPTSATAERAALRDELLALIDRYAAESERPE